MKMLSKVIKYSATQALVSLLSDNIQATGGVETGRLKAGHSFLNLTFVTSLIQPPTVYVIP